MGVEGILHRSYQFAAALLAPFILMMAMLLIPPLHDVLVEIVTDLTTGNAMDTVLIWFVHFLALAAFIGTIVFLYFFVKNKGLGLFE